MESKYDPLEQGQAYLEGPLTLEGQPSRLTVVEQVYYLPAAASGVQETLQFHRELTSDEQPWMRQFKVGEVMQELELAWIERCAQLCVTNLEGRGLQRNPTDEERAAIAERVLELSVDGAVFAVVRPGESCRFEPACVSKLRVRCCSGSARCSIFAVPY